MDFSKLNNCPKIRLNSKMMTWLLLRHDELPSLSMVTITDQAARTYDLKV